MARQIKNSKSVKRRKKIIKTVFCLKGLKKYYLQKKYDEIH